MAEITISGQSVNDVENTTAVINQRQPSTCVITVDEYEIIKRIRLITKEINRLSITQTRVDPIEPAETVIQCWEEMVMLLQFRASKYNYRMDKVDMLLKRWNKIFH
jgi:hypothetical protein